jgi:carboxymethylenebutenolidase
MTDPVTTAWTTIATADGPQDALLALPPGGRGPGLLLLQEIFGVNDHIQRVAAQYALAGFVVLAPDVFWRQTPRLMLGYGSDDRQRGVQAAGALQPAQVVADLQAGVAALRARPEVVGADGQPGRVGAIGYCMGGRLAYSAAALAGVDAAVAYYGGGIQQQLALAPQIRCPIQFHYAEHDDHIPPAAVAAVREAMASHAQAEVHVYPGSHHGFNCWARASYHAPSAALAHGRSLAFLAQALF